MQTGIAEFFAYNAQLIVFLHVLSAVIWVGGMIAIRFAVHPALQMIQDEKLRLARSLQAMGGFFRIVIPMVILLVITAVLMLLGLNFKEGDPTLYHMTFVKEGIWTVMTLNFTVMVIRRNRAERRYLSGDLAACKQLLKPIAQLMIPVNIVLGTLAIYLGVVLRGF